MRSRPVYVLLAGLALTSIVSGCGGASPETRATETLTALHGTLTPVPLEVARTSIASGTFTGIDEDVAVTLTSEAFLRIATPVPLNAERIMVGNE